jgi:3-hydroxyacyl-CoA dehydrogenase/enoyl-CoA hydratase/carnithine racemase
VTERTSELIERAGTLLPDEVVTRALTQLVELPGGGRCALITLDNGQDHTRPNTFGPGGLAALDAALDQVESSDVAAVALTGKPYVFAVGADLGGLSPLTSRAQAAAVAEAGQRVFRRLAALPVPTFAFLNGAALGGGLEVALHCAYRTVSSAVTTLALPECSLGLVPGWGGTQLLPNLVGPDAAVTLIVENPLNQNRMLDGARAAALGLADVLLEPADFLERSLAWAAQVLRGELRVERRPVERGPAWAGALVRGRAIADARLHGAAPAPYRALDLLERAHDGVTEAGFAAEREALTDLIMSQELRAGLYSFNLVTKRARRPAGAPDRALARPVGKVGIVGAGLMASQLAALMVRRLKVPVVLTDIDAERVERAVTGVRAEFERQRAAGRLSADAANRLTALVSGSPVKDAFADADFVVEAVFERLDVKRRVFQELDEITPAACVLATNTSALSVSEIAAGLRHPERVLGFHFFNPVSAMPLVELVRAERTDQESLATALALGRELRKSCVLVRDAPAFVVNRLLTRFLGAIIQAVDEGTPITEADAALDPLGLPMSPLTLLGLVGPAIALHVTETLHAAFPERFSVSPNLARLVAAGKTGLYLPEGDRQVDPHAAELLHTGDAPSAPERIRERALAALAEETALLLAEGVVAQPQDVDLCLLLGAGWPFHLGGITPYLDRTGVSERVTGTRFLPPGIATLP